MSVESWLGENNTLGIDIWHNKYQQNNESFDEWLDRISNKNNKLRKLILEKKFLFGGRILSNRGMQKEGMKTTYSNCYVITPPEDNIESIFKCASNLARTFSYGGGCGIDISKLAPKGAVVRNSAKHTSGAVTFMDLYSMVTELIGQNGRRGALMISLECTHPDLLDFIDIKNDLDRVTKANISLKITTEFMEAVKEKKKFKLKFKREETGESITKTVDAYEVFKHICENNWNMAEPGILFWDRITTYNLVSEDKDFTFAGTNPCAEEPLPAGGSCLLGSLNISAFVREDKTFDEKAFTDAVRIAVRALNECLDEGLPLHPLQEQRDSVSDWRQIGLGVMGVADAFIKMGIRYGSAESRYTSDFIGMLLAQTALSESCNIAKEIGTYPKYNEKAVLASEYLVSVSTAELCKEIKKYGLRNSQILTCAPTGTISTMLGISGGMEPIFANYYTRKTESLKGHDEYYKVYTPIVKQYMDANGLTDDSQLPDYFITSQEIPYKERIGVQAAWQEYIDSSISSTINLPESATVEDIMDLYMYAYEKGLKGVTVYRDNCKRTGILTTKTEEEPKEESNPKRGQVIKVNNNAIGKETHLTTGCGSLHCAAYFDPETGMLVESYLSKGSTGGCQSNLAAISRLISLAARAGVSVYDIADQLDSCMTCPSYAVRRATKKDTSPGSCCPVAIGKALVNMYEDFNKGLVDRKTTPSIVKQEVNEVATKESFEDTTEQERIDNGICPECGSALNHIGGCIQCEECGWSKCM